MKARLIGAAMQLVGMKNVEHTPTDEFLPPDLPNAGNTEKKGYIRKLATQVIDNLVIRREKVDTILYNLLTALEEEGSDLREQNDRGRFICKFPGCGKTFSHNGKRLRDHEATHIINE